MSQSRNLKSLLEGMGAAAPDLVIGGLVLDSRRVEPGDLFVAVQGHGGHGLAHLEQALANGAAAVAWEPVAGVTAPDCEVPDVAVPALRSKVSELAGRFFGEPSLQMFVAGVTGTDGKTSTAHLIAQGLDNLGVPCDYFGTLGNGRLGQLQTATHTTADPVTVQRHLADALAGGARAAAMEVSSHALHQSRTDGVHFDAVVLTNLTRDHLDYHGNVEAYAEAKRRLFEADDARALVINRDDPHGAAWIERFGQQASMAGRLLAYGLGGDIPATAHWLIGRALQLGPDGMQMTLDSDRGSAVLRAGLLGRFNAMNLLAAAGVLLSHGFAIDAVAHALSQVHTVPGRIEAFRGSAAAPLVVVDYAHTPKALEQVLAAVRAHTTDRLICVFGCGGDRDRGKRPLMGGIAVRLADELIVTDDNPRSELPADIVAEILAGVPDNTDKHVHVIHDRASAIRAAVASAGPDDLVLVAGKGHEDYQIHGNVVRHFSDREFVARLLGSEHHA